MQIDGAIVKEQGVTFAIVVVKPYILSSNSTATEAITSFRSIRDFEKLPIILAAQDSAGRFTYFGRTDIVDFLAKIDSSRIPWKRYTIT